MAGVDGLLRGTERLLPTTERLLCCSKWLLLLRKLSSLLLWHDRESVLLLKWLRLLIVATEPGSCETLLHRLLRLGLTKGIRIAKVTPILCLRLQTILCKEPVLLWENTCLLQLLLLLIMGTNAKVGHLLLLRGHGSHRLLILLDRVEEVY